ncbi:MAG: alpha-N-acetylglucosaminidase [Cellulosilyticaceae bacterium]
MKKKAAVVYKLIERWTPLLASWIEVEFIEADQGRDVWEVEGVNKQIVLRGNNVISLALAYHYYLREHLKLNISWCGDMLTLPKQISLPKYKHRQVVEQKLRTYFNYCTFNYTASWWDWERWEREIDFMALNGINMPLSVVGVEAVWYEALLKVGLTDEEARSFLVGPAFLAWQWMTNIESYCGALPKNWITKRLELGRKILARQREWGMQPIGQGFSGFVPRCFMEKFPEASIAKERGWCSFEGTAQLDPLDPLFERFGKVFLETQRELLGAYHFYAADPFHEGYPPFETKDYLNGVGQAIYSLFDTFDPTSVWVMQAWSIREQIATVVPKDRLIILDLNGKTSQNKDYFWGYPFITGKLHNFGGRINLHGDMEMTASNEFKILQEVAPHICGTGLFMESIMQNPIYYDLAFEMMTVSYKVDLNQWVKAYPRRRYGISTPELEEAWCHLQRTIYQPGTDGVEKSSIICARPAVEVKKSGPNDGFAIHYDNKELLRGIQLLVGQAEDGCLSDGYRYDIVDLTRQLLSNHGQKIHEAFKVAFYERNIEAVHSAKARFLGMLSDVDRLLDTRAEFRFEKWVSDARSWGETAEEKDLYDKNASMLVTLWGPEQNASIFDYAWKEWAGLISGYYAMRWAKFYDMIEGVLERGEVYQEDDLPKVYERETLKANAFYEALYEAECQWIHTPKTFGDHTHQDELSCVKEILKKYAQEICA